MVLLVPMFDPALISGVLQSCVLQISDKIHTYLQTVIVKIIVLYLYRMFHKIALDLKGHGNITFVTSVWICDMFARTLFGTHYRHSVSED